MRQIFRFNFVLLVTCLSIGLSSALHAQQVVRPGQRQVAQPPVASKAPAGNKPAPLKTAAAEPKPKEPVVEDLSPEMEEILDRWEAQSAKIKTLHGTQSRSEFNKAFSVEKVTKGPFFLETPDKGRIDMLAITIKKGDVSKRIDKEGNPFTLETGQSERWICTGDSILMLNEDEKTYQREEIPEEQRGKNIVHSPLPFLFGMQAEEAKSRFKLKFDKDKKGNELNNDGYAVLLAKPKMATDQQNYDWARITLDKKKYLPTQVRLYLDETEIVYTFESIVVNDRDIRGTWQRIWKINNDPYSPSLKGYKPVIPPAAAAAPNAAPDKIRQTGDKVPEGKAPANSKRNANSSGSSLKN